MSAFLRGVFAIAKSVITERQNQKLCVVTNKAELLKDFAAHQLEKDFGGTKENIKQSWPFNLSPGPFKAGHKGGPNPKAIANVHKAFVPEALCGRLVGADVNNADGTNQVYSETAHSIFKACGVRLPKECPNPEAQPTANEPEVANNDDLEVVPDGKDAAISGGAEHAVQVEQEEACPSKQDEECPGKSTEEESRVVMVDDFNVTEEGMAPPGELDDAPAPFICCWSCR